MFKMTQWQRPLLAVCASLLCMFSVNAQENTKDPIAEGLNIDEIVNTMKDRFSFTGYAQFGYDYNDQDATKDNSFSTKLAILVATAKITDRATARVMYDFKSNTLFEVWVNYEVAKAFQVKVGEFKTPFSMFSPTMSPSTQSTINDPLAVRYLITGGERTMMKGSTGRDQGVTVYGDFCNKKMSYYLAVMNGTGVTRSDDNSQKDYAARFVVRPASWLNLEASGILGTGWADPEHYTWGENGIKDNGNFERNRWALSAKAETSRFQLMTEYLGGTNGDTDISGYYALATLKRACRNLDLYGCYDYLDTEFDYTSRYTVGMQYWFYPKCRFRVEYALKDVGSQDDCTNTIQAQVQFKF